MKKNEWINGWMDGWMNEWMNKLMKVWIFNNIPAQKQIGYWVPNEWNLHLKKVKSNMYIYLKNSQGYKHSVKSCARIVGVRSLPVYLFVCLLFVVCLFVMVLFFTPIL